MRILFTVTLFFTMLFSSDADESKAEYIVIIFLFTLLLITLYRNRVINKEMIERKAELEAKAKKSQHQLAIMQENRVTQMGEMIENIAHQWRQPLAHINSSILIIDTILAQNNFKNETIEDKLLEIESLTNYMSDTINDFKNFFNSDKGREEFKLQQIVDNSLSILRGVLSTHYIEVEMKIDERVLFYGYPSEIQQVIVVILNNAKDILLSRDIKNPKIMIYLDESDEYYNIVICDNAGGVEEENLEKVFEPYFTTKHKSQGTGISLYISKMIIEDGLQGKLSVQNKNGGAYFKISLPKGDR